MQVRGDRQARNGGPLCRHGRLRFDRQEAWLACRRVSSIVGRNKQRVLRRTGAASSVIRLAPHGAVFAGPGPVLQATASAPASFVIAHPMASPTASHPVGTAPSLTLIRPWIRWCRGSSGFRSCAAQCPSVIAPFIGLGTADRRPYTQNAAWHGKRRGTGSAPGPASRFEYFRAFRVFRGAFAFFPSVGSAALLVPGPVRRNALRLLRPTSD